MKNNKPVAERRYYRMIAFPSSYDGSTPMPEIVYTTIPYKEIVRMTSGVFCTPSHFPKSKDYDVGLDHVSSWVKGETDDLQGIFIDANRLVPYTKLYMEACNLYVNEIRRSRQKITEYRKMILDKKLSGDFLRNVIDVLEKGGEDGTQTDDGNTETA